MSENNNKTKSIENLLQIIRSVKCTPEDKTDAYLTLFRHLQTDKEDCIPVIKKTTNSLFITVQKHIESNNRVIVEAALSFLGHCWATEEIVIEFKIESLKKISNVLCDILEGFKEKTIIIRTLWCFGHQDLPPIIIKSLVTKLVSFYKQIPQHGEIKSETVNSEAMRVIKRLCQQCPEEMTMYLEEWLPYTIELLVSDGLKSQETALSLFESSTDVMLKKPKQMQIYFVDHLNNKGFGCNLNKLFHEEVNPVHVLNAWSCILRILGEAFFDLNRVKVTNPLLKIAEKSFACKMPEVTLALNNLWRSLIDAVFTRPEFSKRMEKIFMLPIKIRYKNEVIAQESLKTQWHLICRIGDKLNDYVEKAVLPLLDVYLKAPEVDPTTNSKITSATTPDRRKSTGNKAPKSPFTAAPKVKMLLAEIFLQLLTEPNDMHKLKSLVLEKHTGPAIHQNILIKHIGKFSMYLLDLTESCVAKYESIISQLWVTFLLHLRQITEKSEVKLNTQDLWSPILSVINDIIERWLSNPMLSLKLLMLLPEVVLKLPLPDKLRTKDTADDEQVTLLIIRWLLHKNFIQYEGFEQERYFILYERAIGVIFASLTGQLVNTKRVFDILQQSHSYLNIQDVRWRLWSTLTSLLHAYVSKTNDVDQGRSFDSNFEAILKSLMYPLRYLDLSKLQVGTCNEMLKVWQQSFEAFTRGVDLLAGVETNLAVETFFKEVVRCKFVESITENKSLTSFTKMVGITSKYLNFSDVNQIYATLMTPTKVTKRLDAPLGNFTSLISVMKFGLEKTFELIPKEGRVVEAVLIDLLDIIENFLSNLQANNILIDCLKELLPSFAIILKNDFKASSKVLMKMEKMLTQVFTCVESTDAMHHDSTLLSKLEPILARTISSSRKFLCNRTGQFWNLTFGKKSNINFSEELTSLLKKHQAKLCLILPNGKEQFELVNVQESIMDDTAQFPESLGVVDGVSKSPKLKTKCITAPSPVKIHGSFLSHTRNSPSAKLGSPKDVLGNFMASGKNKNSPKSPFTNSPGGKNVRRKLPINLNEASCDFVEIKESPATKKKRLLTEHQKEMMRARRELPAMYNDLDQSQDTILMRSQDNTQLTQDAFFKLPEKAKIEEKDLEDGVAPLQDENETDDKKFTGEKIVAKDTKKTADFEREPATESSKTEEATSVACDDDDSKSSEIIPSSQTQDSQSQNKRRKSMLKSNAILSPLPGIEGVVMESVNNIEKDEMHGITEMLDEDIELFDASVSKEIEKTSIENTNEEKWSLFSEADEYPLSKPPSLSKMNFEAKIVVNKLPNKRKRSVPTARRTGHKRKLQTDVANSKENKVPNKRIRKSLDAIDVFEFSDKSVEPIVSKRVRGSSRKSAPELSRMSVEKKPKESEEKEIEIEKDGCQRVARPVPKLAAIQKEKSEITEIVSGSESTKTGSEEVPNSVMIESVESIEAVNPETSTKEGLPEPFVKPDIPTCGASSPSSHNITAIKTTFANYSTCSPTRSVLNGGIPSPFASPASGILKKKFGLGNVDSPSPPNIRRVSFQLPSGTILLGDDIGKVDEAEDNKKSYTSLKKKAKENKKKEIKENKPAVFPDLVKCTASIDRILPSLTFSRGVGHLVRAQNINTVGDLSSLSESQIEALPIRSPKVATVRSALRTLKQQMSRDKTTPKSPLVIGQPTDKTIMDSTTPTKDETSLVEEAALLLTPSRHHDDVKPTSLFQGIDIPKSATELDFNEKETDENKSKPGIIEKETEISKTEGNKSTEEDRKTIREIVEIESGTTDMTVDHCTNVNEICDDSEVVFVKEGVKNIQDAASCDRSPCDQEIDEVNDDKALYLDENIELIEEKSASKSIKLTNNEIPVEQCIDGAVDMKRDFSTQTPDKGLVQNKVNVLELLQNQSNELDKLTNKQLFEFISTLDTLKATVMSELKSRLSES